MEQGGHAIVSLQFRPSVDAAMFTKPWVRAASWRSPGPTCACRQMRGGAIGYSPGGWQAAGAK